MFYVFYIPADDVLLQSDPTAFFKLAKERDVLWFPVYKVSSRASPFIFSISVIFSVYYHCICAEWGKINLLAVKCLKE